VATHPVQRYVHVDVHMYIWMYICTQGSALRFVHVLYTSSTSCVAVCCCSALQCVAACCSVLQCVAVCCSMLQRVAACCSVLQSYLAPSRCPRASESLQYVAACCSQGHNAATRHCNNPLQQHSLCVCEHELCC